MHHCLHFSYIGTYIYTHERRNTIMCVYINFLNNSNIFLYNNFFLIPFFLYSLHFCVMLVSICFVSFSCVRELVDSTAVSCYVLFCVNDTTRHMIFFFCAYKEISCWHACHPNILLYAVGMTEKRLLQKEYLKF